MKAEKENNNISKTMILRTFVFFFYFWMKQNIVIIYFIKMKAEKGISKENTSRERN